MKKRQLLFACSLLVVPLLTALVYIGAGNYLYKPAAAVHTCTTTGTNYDVKIENNAMLPKHIDGQLCDTLKITNDDKGLKLVAFGPHAHHVAYDGVTQKLLSQGQSLIVVLNQTGTFEVHDHLQDIAQGTFTVTK